MKDRLRYGQERTFQRFGLGKIPLCQFVILPPFGTSFDIQRDVRCVCSGGRTELLLQVLDLRLPQREPEALHAPALEGPPVHLRLTPWPAKNDSYRTTNIEIEAEI